MILILLDEIGEMPMDLIQAKLNFHMETSEFIFPMGETKVLLSNFRLILLQQTLLEEVFQGNFREDL